ncbi:hypothetical protein Prudu_012301, partial [Prunus dulcis]
KTSTLSKLQQWVQHANCENIIRSAWNTSVVGTPMFIVVEKIKATRVKLLKWKRGEFNGTNMDIARVRAKLNDLMNQPLDTNLEAHRLLVHNLTSFWIVMKHTSDIVQELLGSRTEIETRSCGEQQVVLDVIEDRITAPMNSILTAAYSSEEIREAPFSMHPTKAPGLEINFTRIVLVPKVKNPQDMTQAYRGKKGFMALKLDMSKAYDRIEWSSLKVSYSFLVNGTLKGYLHPTCGVHRGDPLSPYLFLLCAEGLSALIAKQEREGCFRGISLCRGPPSVNHLLFADDVDDCHTIRDILANYSQASGQQVNLLKSSLCISNNIRKPNQDLLVATLGVQRVDFHDRYLRFAYFDRKR